MSGKAVFNAPSVPFAPGAAAPPPLDLSLDDIIKQRKPAKPAAVGKRPPKVSWQHSLGWQYSPNANWADQAANKSVIKGLLVKGSAQRSAVLAKKRGMGAPAVARTAKMAARTRGITARALSKPKSAAPRGTGGKKPSAPARAAKPAFSKPARSRDYFAVLLLTPTSRPHFRSKLTTRVQSPRRA